MHNSTGLEIRECIFHFNGNEVEEITDITLQNFYSDLEEQINKVNRSLNLVQKNLLYLYTKIKAMKTIEFVKEVNDSDIFYYTQIDGILKISSMSFDKQRAYKNYLKILENENGGKPVNKIEILESIKI